MSILEELEDWVLGEAEVALRSYAKHLERDLERYASDLVARVLRTLVIGAAGVAFLVAGSVFALFGAVTYLSGVVAAPLAWGLVGLGAGACGALLLVIARR
ncbi:MAG: hypothetical protein OK441_02505 [Thaumarchaeota archaeon]|nr:hypothetical protein [Nitrososphaerota archaeon]